MPASEEIHEDPLGRIAEEVRALHPAGGTGGKLVPLGNRGGFSGARLWRGQGAAGQFCLRAWPIGEVDLRVRWVHRLMDHARGKGLDFVPAVYRTRQDDTVIVAAHRVWEMTQWLEGRADFVENPSPARLEAACEALARLHLAWEDFSGPAESCPAVRRRLEVLTDWQRLLTSGWRPLDMPNPQLACVQGAAERAWRVLPERLEAITVPLLHWAEHRRRVQPCLCDLWHDHLLFVGERLTGLVDYGSVKPDQVAVDLARMLGSLVGDDADRWQHGLDAYRRIRPLEADEIELARLLDRTGVVLGVVNWMRWLYHEGRTYDDLTAVARRLEALVARIERWSG